MNDPFNPVMPAEFKLLTDGASTEPNHNSTDNGNPTTGPQKRKRKATRSARRGATSGARNKLKIRWQRLKEKVNDKLDGLDKQKLKTVLAACGIAGGVVTTIIVAVKLVPIAVLLLALFGLAGVIRIWDRLRNLPQPS